MFGFTVRNGHAAAARGLPPPARSGSIEVAAPGTPALAGAEAEVVRSLEQIPPHNVVLTGTDSRAVMRVPRMLERHLCAIELSGGRRALILYDADGRREVRELLIALRTRLVGEGYATSEARAAPEIIRLLLDNYYSRMGRDEEGRSTVSPSQAKQLFESWVDYAEREGATDLHIEIKGNQAIVKVRVHGELEEIQDGHHGHYTAHMAESAVGWAYNNGSGKGSNSGSQFTSTENLYCMVNPRPVRTRQIALRFQSLRGQYGPKIICRLLNVDLNQPTLSYEELGYAESHCRTLRMASRIGQGFVIFSGITGSGKTTTLKTFIETHPGNAKAAFYSIEDPVEYPLSNVHQINLQRDLIDRAGSAAKYSEVVAALMRGDPDGVLMGEIRDPASAIAGQQIVVTGHMAAATVHAHLLSGIVPRLTDEEIGMSRQTLTNPNVLTLLVYQALVPVLCPACKVPASAYPTDLADTEHVHEVLRLLGERFRIGAAGLCFRSLRGCPACRGRGTTGLTVVAEMLMPDRAWLDLIRAGRDYEAVEHFRGGSDGALRSADMTGKTVFEHTLWKALEGQVDPRQCERFDAFSRFDVRCRS